MTDELPPVIVVTGTDTGVGKTVVTAALAAILARRASVAVYKPVQTGLGGPKAVGDPRADIDEVGRLSGLGAVFEGARLVEPLSPTTAARREGVEIPTVADHARRVDALAGEHGQVVVEGSGGVLVGMDGSGQTLADIADGLTTDCGFFVVCRAGLGTLNHTALTVEALRTRGLRILGLVIGAWPVGPGLAEQCNLGDLPAVSGVALAGRLPECASELGPDMFRAAAPGWFAPPIGSCQL